MAGPDSLVDRILVVDNYDSFAYNLVQYVGKMVGEVRVERNDAVDLADIEEWDPDGIVVSPGPGTPADAGISTAIFANWHGPALGVCLGHQALCATHGCAVTRAPAVVHGKSSRLRHDGQGLFRGLPREITVGRYHSLAVGRGTLPTGLEPTAHTVGDDQEIVMAVRDRHRPHVGVQFHPESVLTDRGRTIVRNFLIEVCDGG